MHQCTVLWEPAEFSHVAWTPCAVSRVGSLHFSTTSLLFSVCLFLCNFRHLGRRFANMHICRPCNTRNKPGHGGFVVWNLQGLLTKNFFLSKRNAHWGKKKPRTFMANATANHPLAREWTFGRLKPADACGQYGQFILWERLGTLEDVWSSDSHQCPWMIHGTAGVQVANAPSNALRSVRESSRPIIKPNSKIQRYLRYCFLRRVRRSGTSFGSTPTSNKSSGSSIPAYFEGL